MAAATGEDTKSKFNLDALSYKRACEVAKYEYEVVCTKRGLFWQDHDPCWNLYKAVVDICPLAEEAEKSAPGGYIIEGRSWFSRNEPTDKYLRSPFQQVPNSGYKL